MTPAPEGSSSLVRHATTQARVAIVEGHRLFAEALRIALHREGYDARPVHLQEGHRSVASLLPAIVRLQATVVLIDIDLGGHGNGMRLIEPIVRSGAGVVVVTGNTERARWGEALANGARSVLSKSAPLDDLLATVRCIHQRQAVISREDSGELRQAWYREEKRVQGAQLKLETLTRREAEVLAQLVDGRQVREIARASFVSEATVRTQVKAILFKLEVSSQVAAVAVAYMVDRRLPRR